MGMFKLFLLSCTFTSSAETGRLAKLQYDLKLKFEKLRKYELSKIQKELDDLRDELETADEAAAARLLTDIDVLEKLEIDLKSKPMYKQPTGRSFGVLTVSILLCCILVLCVCVCGMLPRRNPDGPDNPPI